MFPLSSNNQPFRRPSSAFVNSDSGIDCEVPKLTLKTTSMSHVLQCQEVRPIVKETESAPSSLPAGCQEVTEEFEKGQRLGLATVRRNLSNVVHAFHDAETGPGQTRGKLQAGSS